MNTLLQLLPDLASFILYASVKATLLVVLVLLLQRVARNYLSPNARHLLWFIVVLSLITPVGFDNAVHMRLLPGGDATTPAPERVAHSSPASQDLSIRASAPPRFSSPATSVYMEPEAMTETLPSLALAWLPYLWLLGVMYVLGMISVSSHRFAGMLRRATAAPASLQFFLQDCMHQTNGKAAVTVLHSSEVRVPMIAGLFKPVLLLPLGIEQQLTRAQLRHVFLHELMHLQRGDILGNWIVALVQALHWFNPAVWFAFFRMRQDRELACDAATLNHLAPAERLAYGHTLLKLNDALPQTRVPALALGILESHSCLHQRILMLVQGSRKSRLRTLAAGLSALPLAAIAFSQPAVMPAVPAAQLAEPAASANAVQISEALRIAEPASNVVAAAPVDDDARATAPTAAEPARPAETLLATNETERVLDAAIAAQPESPASAVDERPGDPFVAGPDAGEFAAASATLAAEPYTGLADIRELALELDAAKSAKLAFIAEWNAVAATCAERREKLLGGISKPCRQLTMAMARGTISQFGYECWVFTTRQQTLRDAYVEAAAQRQQGLGGIDTALDANARSLADFCDREAIAVQYPAFAATLTEAEAKYTPDGRRRYPAGSPPFVNYSNGMVMSSWVPSPAALVDGAQGYPVAPGAYIGGNTDGTVVAAGGGDAGGGSGGAAPVP